VIAIIKEDKDFQAGRPMKVAYLIETRILPLFDFVRMTRMAVGRNWRLASTEQQTTLTTEFKTLLVRTYSTVLTSYRDQLIEFKQLRMAPDVTEVTVRSDVRQPGRERITIDYDMEKTPTGWKVYDIKVGAWSPRIAKRSPARFAMSAWTASSSRFRTRTAGKKQTCSRSKGGLSSASIPCWRSCTAPCRRRVIPCYGNDPIRAVSSETRVKKQGAFAVRRELKGDSNHGTYST
jgi:hypothetical protein